MGAKSSIEWTDASYTPIRARNLKTGKIGWHCEHATTGCEFCYAESINKRLGTGLPFKPGHRKDIEIFLDEQMLLAPLRWKKPRRVFVCSMTDAFADFVKDEWLDKMFAVMALCPQHTFQVLTKRAERMQNYVQAGRCREIATAGAALANSSPRILSVKALGWTLKAPSVWHNWPLLNVWLGVSAERQQEADERIPLLLQTPAAIRFVSLEPLLGPIDLWQAHWGDFKDNEWQSSGRPLIDWAIVGGESGKNARPMHPDWARSLQKQCESAGVNFFFKQRGEYTWVDDGDYDSDRIPDLPQNWRERKDDKYICMRADGSRADGYAGDSAEFFYRVGKKAAGRLLDGRAWNQMPEVHHA